MSVSLEKYRKRPAKFDGEALEARRREYRLAVGSVRLSGGNPQDDELTELYLTGRISIRDYVRLCQG